MEIDWSIFILETINFLILVWLLAHFFYKPVLKVIARRREEIANELNDAESAKEQAELLKSQYENRLTEWQQERKNARLELQGEISRERLKLFDELKKSLEQERRKAEIVNQRRLDDELRRNEKLAFEQSTTFVSRLFANLASAELEASIIQLSLQNLECCSLKDKGLLLDAHTDSSIPIKVTSAYTLDSATRKSIEKTLSTIIEDSAQCEFKQDPALIAGLRMEIGSWSLRANLKDELKYFSEMNL